MNYSPMKHPAKGFRISYLSKVQDVKSSDSKTNLLEYIVQQVEQQAPQYINLQNGLPHIPDASKGISVLLFIAVSIKKLNQDLTEIKSQLELVEREAAKAPPSNSQDKFKEVMTRFHEIAVKGIKVVGQQLDNMGHFVVKAMEYLAEDSDSVSSEDFFSMLNDFLLNYEVKSSKN